MKKIWNIVAKKFHGWIHIWLKALLHLFYENSSKY